MRTMETRGVLALVLLISMSTAASVIGGGIVGEAAAETQIKIVSMEVPETMEPGEEYQTRVKYRNTGEKAAQVTVGYIFEGTLLISSDTMIAAGETKTFRLRVSLDDAVNSRPGKLYDGTYEHGYRIGNAQAQKPVEVTGLGTPTATATAIEQETVSGESTEDVERRPASDGQVLGESGPLRITNLDMPPEVEDGSAFTVELTVENTADDAYTGWVRYIFDDPNNVVMGIEDERFGPGESRDYELSISTRDIERTGFTLREGQTYPHGVFVPGDNSGQDVRIVDSGGDAGGSDGDDPDAGGSDDARRLSGDESDGSDEPRRGFFSNGEPQVAFLDSFSLTVGGFVLSALGIFHQMLNG